MAMVAYQSPPITWVNPIPQSAEQSLRHEIQQLRQFVSVYEQREGRCLAHYEEQARDLVQCAKNMETELLQEVNRHNFALQNAVQHEQNARSVAENW